MHVIQTTGTTRPDGRIVDNIEGAAYDAGVSLIFEDSDQDGEGPYLHQHPYAETFVIRGGKSLFTVAGEQLLGVAGQVLVVPKLTPHKFEVVGPERYIATHIHASATFITEWLEGPRAGT
ncbi:cupin domain-containing protein [Aeromicrobium panaciterrae]|uniref:cupin domain-containing protein n=1 Tax=Aeromicrobium panaciterrae TaxID=363861 RepID=UPI0031DF1A1E